MPEPTDAEKTLNVKWTCAKCGKSVGSGQGGDVYFEPDNSQMKRIRLCDKHLKETMAAAQGTSVDVIERELEEMQE